MLLVKTLVVGDLDTNCYLISAARGPTSKQRSDLSTLCLIIDPGDSGDFISQTILDLKLKPIAIVLTHGHFDHVLGCLELKLNFQVPILINQSDAKIYSRANKSAAHWQGRAGDPVPPPDQFIKDGDEITVGNEKLKVIATPGHTPGSISLIAVSCQPPAVFTGDTLFKDGVGRTDFSYSNPLQLTKSLANLQSSIFNLQSKIMVYPGHGKAFQQ